MSAPLKIASDQTVPMRAHYEGVAQDTLRILWRRKFLIAAIVVVALFLASIALVLSGPRYTGEATIQLNFNHEEPAAGARSQPTISMDAIALVDSAARVIRSRATASAVVARLGLDRDPDFAREPALWRLLSGVRTALGLAGPTPSPRDLAVNALMQKITVTNEPRSYLISIAITTGDPEQAATLANSVALEYLRGQLLRQLADERAATERELAQLSSVYGVRHPNYIVERTRIENLEARLSAAREGRPVEDAAGIVIGQSFVAAEKVMVPSGPNIILILGLTVGAALAAGIWLALLLRSEGAVREHRHAIHGERTLEDTMASNYNQALRRPATLVVVATALIGWLLFFWCLANSNPQWAQEHSRLTTLEQQNRQLDDELKKEQAAAGSLPDIETKRAAAEAAAAVAQQAAADAAQARREAEAKASQARDALAQATARREAAEKASVEASAEHDRIAAETASAQLGSDALKQQVAQLNDQIADRKTEQAGLDKQVDDLRATLASLTAAHEQAAKAVADANAERDRIVGESAAAQQSNDALKQQLAQMNEDLAARKADLIGVQDQLQSARAEATEQGDIEKQLAAARDQLEQALDQKATEQRAAADALDQLAARNRDLADLENRLAQDRETLKQATAQHADIEKTVADSAARRDQLAADAEKAQNAVAALQKQLAELSDQAAQRNRDLAALNAQLEKAHSELNDARSQVATQRENPSQPTPAAAAAESQAPAGSQAPTQGEAHPRGQAPADGS